MSVYWKQSLWLGGVYWIVSLILASIDTFETYFIDFILSLYIICIIVRKKSFRIKKIQINNYTTYIEKMSIGKSCFC